MKLRNENDDELERLNTKSGLDSSKRINDDENNKSIFIYFIYFILLALTIGIIILIVTLVLDKNIFSKNKNYIRNDNSILLPNSDYKKYRTLSLKNGLEAILISDPLAVTSAVSLSVRVGANKDPDNLLGLAHFCEHMLFLGSRKYPRGDDYFKTVTENNGHFNAYTDREITNYFFDVHFSSFEKTLDIFSRFFIDPLFSEDKVNKEVNSVNSEFEKNLIIDSRKKSQVFADLMEKTNPFSRFTTGNIQTLITNAKLNGLNIRDELIKFHSDYYVSDKMKLVVYSNDNMEDLEEMIVDKFNGIKSSPEFVNVNLVQNSTIVGKNNTQNLKSSAHTLKEKQTKNQNLQHKFINPFKKETLGSLVQFKSINLEHELSITFIQKPLNNDDYFFNNPFYYYEFILESKDEFSLIEILKKKGLATKISVNADRDYYNFSDFSINLSLTKEGMKNLKEVLGLINGYFTYLKDNLISKKYYDYLKTVSYLNFQYKLSHGTLPYQYVSSLGGKFQRYPLKYLLDDTHLINEFDHKILREYSEVFNLENSIIFLPDISYNSTLNYDFLLSDPKSNYEPWYKTNYTFYKVNYTMIPEEKIEFSEVKLLHQETVENLINQNKNFSCDGKCISQLKLFSNSEPNLLNKTNLFELWYKKETTLDFRRVTVDVLFQFEKFDSPEERINILLLEAMIKRKIKKLKSKLKFFSNKLSTTYNNHGIKISITSYTEDILAVSKELVDKLTFLTIPTNSSSKEFELLTEEVKEHLMKEYNGQPWALAYEYLQKNMLTEYITSEEYLKYLSNSTYASFNNFLVNKFQKKYYTKLLVIGDLSETLARSIFTQFNPILKIESISTDKTFSWSIKEKRKNKRIVFKKSSGNYLLRKEYHEPLNKNNALLKCFKIGKHTYKNEIMLKLFNSIIGNVVFRELRINKQFGYVAKSKIEVFDNHFFFCIHVQGSSKLPHVIDDATHDLLNIIIDKQLDKLTSPEFDSAKSKSFDVIAETRLDLSKASNKNFNAIMENTYNFPNYNIMNKYSKSIKKEDLISFFNYEFLGEENLKFTVYMYSKNVPAEKRILKSEKNLNYIEIKEDF